MTMIPMLAHTPMGMGLDIFLHIGGLSWQYRFTKMIQLIESLTGQTPTIILAA
jgi:hypothetical protein